MFDQFRVEVPVIGNLFRKLYVARFAEALSVLLKGGVPVAQAIEIVWAMESLPDACDKVASMDDPPTEQPMRKTGSGTGAVEAPRGTLYHHYELKDGLVDVADIITPTAQNLDDIEMHMKLAAERMLAEGKKDDEVRLGLEMIARAYDPCISCATHLVTLKRA